MSTQKFNGLAVVTGASTGIGFELARCAAKAGHDLIIAADEDRIFQAARELEQEGVTVTPVLADLAQPEGIEILFAAIVEKNRPVSLLMANAGQGLGGPFLEQDIGRIQRVIDTNISGTLALVHEVGRLMKAQNQGRILFTGSIAGFMPGSFQAVYNGTKAFINSFSFALREELSDTDITVTCLMPGATETEFFRRADMLDTKVGEADKDDPAFVAQQGFDAMMAGKGDVVSGWKNKVMSAVANVTPAERLAKQHRQMSERERPE